MAAFPWSAEERTFHGLTFPEMVEDAVLCGFTDHEATAPGYGYSAAFYRPGWEMTVYIYDHGLSEIPNDVVSGPMREEFENSMQAIELREKGELRREFVASLGGPKFLCASYLVRSASAAGGEVESLLSVTTFKNRFVKFRVSGIRTEMSEVEAQEFVAAWAPILWPEIVPISPRDELIDASRPSRTGGAESMTADSLREMRTLHGLTFPETIEGAVYAGSYNNESKVPGMGYTAVYKRPGWSIQISIYNLGLPVIPNDKSSQLLRAEFEEAKLEVRRAGYDEVEPDRWFELFRADGQMMLCATCIITSAAHGFDGADSILAVTAWNNKFIKFRVTAPHGETSETDISRFVAVGGDLLFPTHN